MSSEAAYICTQCGVLLKSETEALVCSQCNTSITVSKGIPQFSEDYAYWGEVTQDVMVRINLESRNRYWKDVLREELSVSNRGAEVFSFLDDLNRANWHLLLDIPKQAVVLDIGAGMGTISHSLSRYYDTIHAIETVPERLEFSRIRFNQEGCQNIKLARANLLNLPFAENSFDLVVMNGVLEWVGMPENGMRPDELQLEALRKIRKILKPGGYLYIGIENRVGYNFFLGRLDHTNLKYTSLLPRPLANLYTNVRLKKPYRAYTYSLGGYRRLLSQAGYSRTTFYSPIPGYNRPNLIFELKKQSIDYFVEKYVAAPLTRRKLFYAFAKVLSELRLFQYFSPDYLCFAQLNAEPRSSKVLRHIKQNASKWQIDETVADKLWLFTQNNSGSLGFHVCSGNTAILHVKVKPEDDVALEREVENYAAVNKLLPEELRKTIPGFMDIATLNGCKILVQQTLPGKRLDEILGLLRHPDSPKEQALLFGYLDMAKDWLIQFHKAIRRQTVDATEHAFDKEKFLQQIHLLYGENEPNMRERAQKTVSTIIEELGAQTFQTIPQHGDYCASNLLVTKQQINVVDWENFGETTVPLFDLLHLVTTTGIAFLKSKNSDGSKEFNQLYFDRNKISNYSRAIVNDYCAEFGIDTRYVNHLLLVYLLTYHNRFHTEMRREPARRFLSYIRSYLDNQRNHIIG